MFVEVSIKIKSCKDEDVFPSTFTYQGKEHTGPEEIGNLFNTFFTTMSSKSLSSDEEGDDYIEKTFSYLKSNNRIRLKTGNFKFSHTTERIVEKLIQNLDASSGAGHSGIPTKVIKYCRVNLPHSLPPSSTIVLMIISFSMNGSARL